MHARLYIFALAFFITGGCHVARYSEFRGEKLQTDRAVMAAGRQAAE